MQHICMKPTIARSQLNKHNPLYLNIVQNLVFLIMQLLFLISCSGEVYTQLCIFTTNFWTATELFGSPRGLKYTNSIKFHDRTSFEATESKMFHLLALNLGPLAQSIISNRCQPRVLTS